MIRCSLPARPAPVRQRGSSSTPLLSCRRTASWCKRLEQQPVLIAVSDQADPQRCQCLEQAGCELLTCSGASPADRLRELLLELGRRQMTNVLVEGGGKLLGSLFDAGLVDEVHVFVAPKLVGGQAAPTPLAGSRAGRDTRIIFSHRATYRSPRSRCLYYGSFDSS